MQRFPNTGPRRSRARRDMRPLTHLLARRLSMNSRATGKHCLCCLIHRSMSQSVISNNARRSDGIGIDSIRKLSLKSC